MQNLSQRIKATRIERGLSQSRLAAETGVSQPTVTNWEKGSHDPRKDALKKISTALGVREDWLLTGEHSQSQSAAQTYLAQPVHHIPVYAWPLQGEGLFARPPESYFPMAGVQDGNFALLKTIPNDAETCVLVFSAPEGDEVQAKKLLCSNGNRLFVETKGNIADDSSVKGILVAEIKTYA